MGIYAAPTQLAKNALLKVSILSGTAPSLVNCFHVAIAQALRTKVYCDAHKMAILRCQNDPELHALLTEDPSEAGVHLLPLGMIVSDKLKAYVQRFKGVYSRAVGFRPTGWT